MIDLFSVRELLRSRMSPGGTHWGECWRVHVDCAAWRLLEEVDRLELEHDELLADNEQLLAEVARLSEAGKRPLYSSLDGSEGGEDG